MIESMRCRGMRDTLPEEMQRFRRVEQAFREVCHGWRYREVRTPVIEHLHLFTAAGTLSPQLLGRVYSFLDWDGWSGERVVLRPDSTIPTARLYLESLRDEGIARLFYVQNVFRFAQGEESREDWQLGVELIGDTQPAGDIELILMGCETLERLGLEPQLRLSDPGILRAVLARAGFGREEQITLYDRILDGDAGALEEVAARLPDAGATARALLSAEGEGLAYLNNLRIDRGALVRRVIDAGPAQRPGIRVGDVILRIARNEINDDLPFINALSQVRTNERLNVEIWRDGRSQEVAVELTPR